MIAMLIANLLVSGLKVSESDSTVPHDDIDKEVAHAEKHKFDEV